LYHEKSGNPGAHIHFGVFLQTHLHSHPAHLAPEKYFKIKRAIENGLVVLSLIRLYVGVPPKVYLKEKWF
jgi:hypothetical protein